MADVHAIFAPGRANKAESGKRMLICSGEIEAQRRTGSAWERDFSTGSQAGRTPGLCFFRGMSMGTRHVGHAKFANKHAPSASGTSRGASSSSEALMLLAIPDIGSRIAPLIALFDIRI